MKDSQSLLAEYIQSRSEEAFGRLMKCHVDLVYSTAMRLVRGDSHLAEDVTQSVFLQLAKKANRLSPDVMLGGWLHKATCLIASTMLRAERRRQLRERQAVELTMETNETTIFSEIAPILDEAINQLGEEDRKAILLRFYERLDVLAVGEQLGSSENAAQKRVSRALDQLHSILIQRGISAALSATALGTALAARAVEATPAEVVASLAKAGLASAAVGHGTALSFLKGMTASRIGLSAASVIGIAGASWLAWSLWGSWWPAKPPPLALNGTWTVLSKAQPPGHVVEPWALALDPDDQLYVAHSEGGGRIQKRDRNGNWSLVASAGQAFGGLNRRISAMAFDRPGNLYVASIDRIVRRDSQGSWTHLSLPEGTFWPRALVLDRDGNLYVAAGRSERAQILLRKPDGQWISVAGPGSQSGEVIDPDGLILDAQGNLYVGEPEAQRIQKRDATGHWSMVDLKGIWGGELETLPEAVDFGRITCDTSGGLYVAASGDPLRPALRPGLLKRDPKGHWEELAEEGSGLGQVANIMAMSFDARGALYVAESGYSRPRIQKRDSGGRWSVVCESLEQPGTFVTPTRLALNSRGDLYVLDELRHQVQKRDAQGRWTMLVDPPNHGFPLPPGPATRSMFRFPSSIAVDRYDNLYVADQDVMKLNRRGEWEVFVPVGGELGQTSKPLLIWMDRFDNFYLFDARPRRLQKRDRKGRWTVLAKFAGWDGPGDICAAPNGDIYIWGFINGQSGVFRLDSHGDWMMVAPVGDKTGEVQQPTAIAADAIGRLYVSDLRNQRVQIREVDGKWFALDAEAEADLQGYAWGIAVDRQGAVYISDPPRVLRWTPQPKTKAARVDTETKK